MRLSSSVLVYLRGPRPPENLLRIRVSFLPPVALARYEVTSKCSLCGGN